MLSTYIVGRAEGYNRNMILMPTPTRIPYSTPMIRQNTNVAQVAIRSFLLDLHIGFTTSYSIIKMTALMITAAREALGMKAKYGVRKLKARITIMPEKADFINTFTL